MPYTSAQVAENEDGHTRQQLGKIDASSSVRSRWSGRISLRSRRDCVSHYRFGDTSIQVIKQQPDRSAAATRSILAGSHQAVSRPYEPRNDPEPARNDDKHSRRSNPLFTLERQVSQTPGSIHRDLAGHVRLAGVPPARRRVARGPAPEAEPRPSVFPQSSTA